ncbi:MAG TPA: TetR/AcrR family transcriptional regulator [Candidatus Dietzia merdigallinarum]|nr:TetR/AcrR family transcriptional regulator [Candidatus Dietzia merdigallinarum]
MEASLYIIRNGEQLSMDSAARASGLTKPGLTYHFPDKESLVTALLDHVLDGYESGLAELLGDAVDSPRNRARAYVTQAITGSYDSADLVMMCDPKLMSEMTERWGNRMNSWFAIPDDISDAARTRWHAARLMADGAWFIAASGMPDSGAQAKGELLRLALDLIEGESQS